MTVSKTSVTTQPSWLQHEAPNMTVSGHTDSSQSADIRLSNEGCPTNLAPSRSSAVQLELSPSCDGRHAMTESPDLLIALATQERRILELKEELQKAETDLQKLKKQWVAHEAFRRDNSVQPTEQMQKVRMHSRSVSRHRPIRNESAEQGRRMNLCHRTRSSQPKIFPGSRHMQSLSLLPQKSTASGMQVSLYNDSVDVFEKIAALNETAKILTASGLAAAAKSPRIVNESFRSPEKEMLMETGKQLVGDFRQGFWTFVGDLKQVTVGDEVSHPSYAFNSLRAADKVGTDEDRRTRQNINATSPSLVWDACQ